MRYGQTRDLPAYQCQIHINKMETVKQGDAADISHVPKPNNRWDQFSKAVTTEGKLYISGDTFKDQIHKLAAWLQTSPANLKCISLYGGMQSKDVGVLVEAFKVNTKLTEIAILIDDIDYAVIEALSEALQVNTTLTSFVLSANIGDAGAQVLGHTLETNTTLTTLDLSHNSIGVAGALTLAEALKVNKALVTLDLDNNAIGTAGALGLACALLRKR